MATSAAVPGSRMVFAGLPNPADPFTIPAVSLVAEAKTIIGSYMGSAVPARDIPRYIALYRAGRLPVDRLLTHRLQVIKLCQRQQLILRVVQGLAMHQIRVPANEPLIGVNRACHCADIHGLSNRSRQGRGA